jgi:hypothetical protein
MADNVTEPLARATWAVEHSEKGHDLRPLVADLAAALRGLESRLTATETVIRKLVEGDEAFGRHTKQCQNSPCAACEMHAEVQTAAFKRASDWLASVSAPEETP